MSDSEELAARTLKGTEQELAREVGPEAATKLAALMRLMLVKTLDEGFDPETEPILAKAERELLILFRGWCRMALGGRVDLKKFQASASAQSTAIPSAIATAFVVESGPQVGELMSPTQRAIVEFLAGITSKQEFRLALGEATEEVPKP